MMTAVHVQKLNDALRRAEAHAPYLKMLMGRFPNVTDRLASGLLDQAVPSIDLNMPVGRALRIAKGQQALTLAIGDLAGLLSLDDVVGHLSAFADLALHMAIRAAIEAVTPGAEPIGFAAIALGKHGSFELNYSSDIDPVLLFDPDTLPRRARDEPVEAAVRIGRKLVELMQMRDGDGYVFRVDLRLRPTPEVTPIVLPVDAAIQYYESQAVAWERAAFIRARACAGDVAVGQYFLDAIRPFVWRRGLDFGAIGEIRGMSRRIRGHHSSGQVLGPGYDLKRGRGGIREVEFFAQIHQLIHGGREQNLRVAPTQAALDALADAGRIDPAEAATLKTAYRLYRTVEHRLQMVDDQQTHMLPKSEAALAGVAALHGLASGEALVAELAPHVAAVGTIYDALDGDKDAVPGDEDQLAVALRDAGFDDVVFATSRIAHWRDGTIRALRTPAARDALEAILPGLLAALGQAPEPKAAMIQFSNLIERLPSAINLFRLLEARPALQKLLVDIVIHAPTLAEQLVRRTELLDRLIDATAFDPVGSVAAITTDLQHDGDLEQKLDYIRRVVGENRFALGVQVMEGAAEPMVVAAGYARVAEAAIVAVADAVIAEFQRAHGLVAQSELVILALGRMGGAELTHASDLDLIYLFTGDFSSESDGGKPLGAVQYYNRLAQRITAGLSVSTAAGPLYEVDTRLRPSGAQGPLVVSLDGFERYQKEDAWTWEHMALTRARLVYGSADARAATAQIIADVLAKPRDPAVLLADAVKMRNDMARHKPGKGALDVKLSSGGLVDLEFCIHIKQLLNYSSFHPELSKAISGLVDAGHLPADMIEAHRLMTRLLVTLRLLAPDLVEPDPSTRALIARACNASDWQTLLEQLAATRQSVSKVWGEITALAKGD
jgi:[glutamine synthetase] adenylyltransferase / [glutamine synthetase]-adenylyl-L-tyrosine phosphorylase